MTLTLSKATLSDADIIWNIIQKCSAFLVTQGFENWTRYTKEKIEQSLLENDVYLLKDSDTAIGTIALSKKMPSYYTDEDMNHWADKNAPALYFTTLAVLPDEQKKGYGSKLILFAEETARKQGVEYMRMTSLQKNTELAEYYKRKGYHTVQTRLVETLNLTLNFSEKKL